MTARRALVVAVVLATAGVAHAYPQFQLRDGPTCAGCQIVPSGGGLLNATGLSKAEDLGHYASDAAVLHGAISPPTWLTLGGDLRLAGGVRKGRAVGGAFFPMELDLRGAARWEAFTLYTTIGGGVPNQDDPSTAVLLTEHFLLWKQHPGKPSGLSARVGRFLPVYGLRQPEHPYYVRQYVTPLYGETYGAAVSYVDPGFEVHAGGFLHDPWRYSSEHGDGASLYAEKRFAKVVAVGVTGRYVTSDVDTRTSGGVTGKVSIPAADLLLSTEVDVIHQTIEAGGERTQTAALLVASWFPRASLFADLAVGHYDEDVDVDHLDREAIDLGVHWFTTSHVELVWMNRVQALAMGDGGPTTWFSLIQVHYRM